MLLCDKTFLCTVVMLRTSKLGEEVNVCIVGVGKTLVLVVLAAYYSNDVSHIFNTSIVLSPKIFEHTDETKEYIQGLCGGVVDQGKVIGDKHTN